MVFPRFSAADKARSLAGVATGAVVCWATIDAAVNSTHDVVSASANAAHKVPAEDCDFRSILLGTAFVVNDAFDHLHQFGYVRHTERLLPQAGRFVADDENRLVIVFLFDVLA